MNPPKCVPLNNNPASILSDRPDCTPHPKKRNRRIKETDKLSVQVFPLNDDRVWCPFHEPLDRASRSETGKVMASADDDTVVGLNEQFHYTRINLYGQPKKWNKSGG
jgi:hypothetical protein